MRIHLATCIRIPGRLREQSYQAIMDVVYAMQLTPQQRDYRNSSNWSNCLGRATKIDPRLAQIRSIIGDTTDHKKVVSSMLLRNKLFKKVSRLQSFKTKTI